MENIDPQVLREIVRSRQTPKHLYPPLFRRLDVCQCFECDKRSMPFNDWPAEKKRCVHCGCPDLVVLYTIEEGVV